MSAGRRLVASPLLVAAVVFVLYGAFVVSVVRTNGVYTFIDQGTNFVEQGHTDPAIHVVPGQVLPGSGYDGQFFYYIALDPFNAAPYIDDPAYRYGRIAYPILARLLAFGVDAAIPWAMVVINLAANTLGTLALAVWLRRRSFSPWLAVIFGLAPGMVVAVQYDLAESMAYGLCAFGVLAMDTKRLWLRAVGGGLLFSVAALTRETTIVYGLVFAAWTLLQVRDWSAIRSRFGPAILLAALTVIPYLVWRQLVEHWFPGTMPPFRQSFEVIPYFGLWYWFFHTAPNTGAPFATFAVAIPGTIFGVWVAYLLWRSRGRYVYGWLYLANFIPFVVFIARFSYDDILAATRASDGVILAAVLCLPVAYRQARERTLALMSVCTALWMALTPLWLLAPIGIYIHDAIQHRLLR